MRSSLSASILAAGLLAVSLPAASASAATPDATPAFTVTLAAKNKKKSTKPPTPAQLAFRARQKGCRAEWPAAKIEKGMKWPPLWSACDRRLKRGG